MYIYSLLDIHEHTLASIKVCIVQRACMTHTQLLVDNAQVLLQNIQWNDSHSCARTDKHDYDIAYCDRVATCRLVWTTRHCHTFKHSSHGSDVGNGFSMLLQHVTYTK